MYSDTLADISSSTGFCTIEKGKDVKRKAKSIVNLSLIYATSKSTIVSLLTTSIDILTNFVEVTSISNINNVAASSDDYLQVNLTYDDFTQWTYGKVSQSWKLGLISKRVDVIQIQTCTYIANSKKKPVTTIKDDIINLKSPNFSDPGPAAWKHAQQEPLVENICWKCSGAKFMFN